MAMRNWFIVREAVARLPLPPYHSYTSPTEWHRSLTTISPIYHLRGDCWQHCLFLSLDDALLTDFHQRQIVTANRPTPLAQTHARRSVSCTNNRGVCSIWAMRLMFTRWRGRYTPHLDPPLAHIYYVRVFTSYKVIAALQNTPSDDFPLIILDLLSTFYDQNITTVEAFHLLKQVQIELQRLRLTMPIVVSACADMNKARMGLLAHQRGLTDLNSE